MISSEITTFEQMVLLELEKIKPRKKDNLTKAERIALEELKNEPDIVIKPADKGGGIVLMTKENYEKEALRILNEKKPYETLPGDPTTKIKQKFKDFIDKGKELGIIKGIL